MNATICCQGRSHLLIHLGMAYSHGLVAGGEAGKNVLALPRDSLLQDHAPPLAPRPTPPPAPPAPPPAPPLAPAAPTVDALPEPDDAHLAADGLYLATYRLTEGLASPSSLNNALRCSKYNVFTPPYKERSPNSRLEPPSPQSLETLLLEGATGPRAGMTFHWFVYSHANSGYIRNVYFPNIMSPTGKLHGMMISRNRGSKMGLLADYVYMVLFAH